MNEQTKPTAGSARRPLRVDFRQQKTSGLEVEPRRALAVYRALNLSDDRTSSQMLLDSSGRRMRLERGAMSISSADCTALASRLRRSGYPLTDDGIRRFKMERGFSSVVRIGPDIASAYARFVKGVETRINVTREEFQTLDEETRCALKLLMHIGREPTNLMVVRQALGVRDSDKVPNGTILVGRVTAERLVRWAHQTGWTLDGGGLAKIARVRGAANPAVDAALARFVADAVLCRNEPAHDYTHYSQGGKVVNRRTVLMLKAAEARLGELRLGISKGSYVDTGRGAHPHMGGGVVDVFLGDVSSQMVERAVLALREVGFAAWSRSRAESSHIHAVAIGDREMAAAAWWQVKAFFRGRDGRTRAGRDPHRHLKAKAPRWTARYRIAAL